MLVRWYLAYSLSYRNIEELAMECGLSVDHSTVNHWVIEYAPQLEESFRKKHKRPVGVSWRMDETYINGAKKLVAENLILRKQLIVSNRNRKKAPNLTMWERLCFACLATIIGSKRILSLAIVIKPSTLLKLHHYH